MSADAGYADQAHLCRDVRRFTGYAPRELQAGIARGDHDEGLDAEIAVLSLRAG